MINSGEQIDIAKVDRVSRLIPPSMHHSDAKIDSSRMQYRFLFLLLSCVSGIRLVSKISCDQDLDWLVCRLSLSVLVIRFTAISLN